MFVLAVILAVGLLARAFVFLFYSSIRGSTFPQHSRPTFAASSSLLLPPLPQSGIIINDLSYEEGAATQG